MPSRRSATLVNDDDFEDFYRPEPSREPRAGRRAMDGLAAAASARDDFADRTRARRTRAAVLREAAAEVDYEEDSYPSDAHEDEEEPGPRNRRRRVAVSQNGVRGGVRAGKRGWIATKWGRVGMALALLAVAGALTSVFLLVRGFFLHDPRFRIASSSIQILGNSEIGHAELLSVFAPDLEAAAGMGRNIFTVPLAERRAALEQLPWVRSATVMRLWPNQIRVAVVERVPVAFVRVGSKIELVDASGVILSMPPSMLAARHYSFPVVAGINPGDAAQTRADRMQIYERFIEELDTSAPGGAVAGKTAQKSPGTVSQQLSEVDVSDPEDVRALLPSAGSDILVHFGDQSFAERYRKYRQDLPQWRLQYPHLAAVDLRYDQQAVLEMAKGAQGNGTSGAASGAAVDATPTLAATPTVRPKAAVVKKPAAHNAKAQAKTAAKPNAKIVVKPVTQKVLPQGGYAAPVDNPRLHHG